MWIELDKPRDSENMQQWMDSAWLEPQDMRMSMSNKELNRKKPLLLSLVFGLHDNKQPLQWVSIFDLLLW